VKLYCRCKHEPGDAREQLAAAVDGGVSAVVTWLGAISVVVAVLTFRFSGPWIRLRGEVDAAHNVRLFATIMAASPGTSPCSASARHVGADSGCDAATPSRWSRRL
jgi:hypothetical protein